MSTENDEKEPVVKTESKDYYYAVQNGKKFLKHRPVKRNPKEWTEEQRFIRNRISGTSKFASKNLENLILDLFLVEYVYHIIFREALYP